MKKELVTLILLMLCIGSTAQEKLFKEGLVRARYAKNFYIARNDRDNAQTINVNCFDRKEYGFDCL